MSRYPVRHRLWQVLVLALLLLVMVEAHAILDFSAAVIAHAPGAVGGVR